VGIGPTKVDVAVLRNVLIATKMRHVTQVAALAALVQPLSGITTEHLSGCLKKHPWVGYKPRNRDAGVADAVFAANQVRRDERPVGPWQHVIVQSVDLAKRRAHLADLGQKSARERCEGQVSLLEIDAFLAKRQKEVGTRVWVDNSLERRL